MRVHRDLFIAPSDMPIQPPRDNRVALRKVAHVASVSSYCNTMIGCCCSSYPISFPESSKSCIVMLRLYTIMNVVYFPFFFLIHENRIRCVSRNVLIFFLNNNIIIIMRVPPVLFCKKHAVFFFR